MQAAIQNQRKGLLDLLRAIHRRVLIVEDDLTLQPFWKSVFQAALVPVELDWATNLNEAEGLMRLRFKQFAPYDLVIADIHLDGQGTGIDLWNHYGEEAMNFVFMSGLPMSNLDLITSLDFGCPVYLKKPLSVRKCKDTVLSLLK